MTSIQGFINGILDLDSGGKDILVATVTRDDFGASLDQHCKKHHLQVLLELLPGLELTKVQRQIIKNALTDAIKGKRRGVVDSSDDDEEHVAKRSKRGQSDTLDKLAALVPFLQAMVTKITLRPDSSKTSARQLRQAAFKLDLYRYYYSPTAAQLPSRLKCMVTGMTLSANLVIAARLIPRAHPEVAALVCNIPDVDSPRNGLLWAGPIEKAWSEHDIAFIPDKQTHQLKFRVLTQPLMTTRLMDYNTQANSGESFRMQQFSSYDDAVLLVQPGATPYRRALLLQAVNAVSQHAAAGDLRAGITCSAADFEVESDFDNRPSVEAWVRSTLSQHRRL